VTALVLDYDSKLTAATVAEAAVAWSALAGSIHTTWSNSAAHPCFRVILPFARPVTPDEFARVWGGRARRRSFFGHKVDPAARDASRLWFLPAVRPGAEHDYRFVRLTGALLDFPDRVLAAAASAQPVRGNAGANVRPRTTKSRRFQRTR